MIRKKKFVLPLTTTGFFTGFLETIVDVVRLIRGNPCTVQGSNSETLLHVPEGVYAAVLGNTRTDHGHFRQHIPQDDCLIAPICEYHLEPFIGDSLPTNAVYKLQMPHIVRDVPQVRKHIRVRHGDLHSNAVLPVYQLEKDKFEIDEKYVTIYARHFSGYIVTAESINCCSRSANMLLFELIASNPGNGTLVTLKVYLSSILSKIQDYQRVNRDLNILTYYYERIQMKTVSK